MKIQVEFFTDSGDFIKAIGAGIYRITVKHYDKREILYIGESVFILVRCATHLFELKRNPHYLGFNESSIEDNEIVLRFELVETCNDMKERKRREKRLIEKESPIMQSGISDRMKSIDEKIEALTAFLAS